MFQVGSKNLKVKNIHKSGHSHIHHLIGRIKEQVSWELLKRKLKTWKFGLFP